MTVTARKTKIRVSHRHRLCFVCLFVGWLVCLPVLRQPLEQFRTPDEFVERGHDGREGRPVGALLLPTIQHEIVDGLGAVHRSRESASWNKKKQDE